MGFALLVALGCLGWAWFLDFGRFSFASHDWPKELDYLSTLHDAATRHLVPWRSTVAQQGTDGLLANPEVPLSPDVVLLRWIGPGAFLAVHTVIAFALGALGCLRIARQERGSLATAAIALLLFGFNGHVAAHLGVGHSMWSGYFFSSWLAAATLEIAREPAHAGSAGAATRFGATGLLLMCLWGAFHVAVWWVLFLLLLSATRPKLARPALGLAGLGLGLAAVRLLPAAVVIARPAGAFLYGYPHLSTLLASLVVAQPLSAEVASHPLAASWELDAFVGAAGFVAIAWFVVVAPLVARARGAQGTRDGLTLQPAMALMVALASDAYAWVHHLAIPLLQVERVSSRLIAVPLVLGAFLAARGLQRALERRTRLRWLAFALTGAVTALLARELLAHFAALSLRATGQAATAPWSFSSARVSAQGPGGAYAASLALGALITIAAAVTALRLVRPGLAPSEPT